MKQATSQSMMGKLSSMMGVDQLQARLRHLRGQSEQARRIFDMAQSEPGKWMISFIQGELASVRSLYRTIPVGAQESLECFRAIQFADETMSGIVYRLKNTPESREDIDKEILMLDNRLRSMRETGGHEAQRLVPKELTEE